MTSSVCASTSPVCTTAHTTGKEHQKMSVQLRSAVSDLREASSLRGAARRAGREGAAGGGRGGRGQHHCRSELQAR